LAERVEPTRQYLLPEFSATGAITFDITPFPFSDEFPQYFYTIKDLRQVILSMQSEGQLELAVKDKLSDAQLQKHRVGGRLVTRKEIERSRKCKLS
jgi:hypothetical protein